MALLTGQTAERVAFGTLVKARREGIRLSQERLAEKAGLAVRTIRNVELGQGCPSDTTVTRLVDALGVDASARAALLAAAAGARAVPGSHTIADAETVSTTATGSPDGGGGVQAPALDSWLGLFWYRRRPDGEVRSGSLRGVVVTSVVAAVVVAMVVAVTRWWLPGSDPSPASIDPVPGLPAGTHYTVTDGAYPSTNGCDEAPGTLSTAPLRTTDSAVLGVIELRYSRSCGAAWARFVPAPDLVQVPAALITITITVTRHPDATSYQSLGHDPTGAFRSAMVLLPDVTNCAAAAVTVTAPGQSTITATTRCRPPL